MSVRSRRYCDRVPRHPLRVPAVVAAVVLLLSGCWLAPDPEQSPSAAPSTAEPTFAPVDEDMPKALARYYRQGVTWTDCGGSFECATVDVPLDYADPGGESISIALKRLPATDPQARLGSLLVNPGGPGGSGIQLVEAAPDFVSDSVLAAYDVVGFDPRGVGQSTPITCVDDARLDELRAVVHDRTTPEGLAAARADAEELAQACAENTGELLGYVDTTSATRDMDVLRGVLGDEQLSYLGFSYGTSLGASYADLFPERVGRLVLDGAVDPELDYVELGVQQAEAFERTLRTYVADCQAGEDCPLTGDVDAGLEQLTRFLDLLVGSPLETGTDRPLTQSLAVSGIFLALYDDAYWPILTEALTSALRDGDGSALLFLADLSADRESGGGYSSNSWVAFQAITCVDFPVDASQAAMDAEAARLREVAPTVGDFFAYGEVTCDVWPIAPVGAPGRLDVTGTEPILVVGTTGDPATPYPWSESLAEQLDGSVLLTFDGEGHTAYGRSNACVQDAVDAYLIEGTLPEAGLVC